jgi:hypothetical protein
MIREFVWTSMWRAWIAFAALTVFGFVMTLLLAFENPLRSDDPYLNGVMPGLLVAAMSLVYSITEALSASRWWGTFWYGLALCLWAGFVLAMTHGSNEGEDMGKAVACISLAAGAMGWPLFAFRMPRKLAAVLTISTLLILMLYSLLMLRWTFWNG